MEEEILNNTAETSEAEENAESSDSKDLEVAGLNQTEQTDETTATDNSESDDVSEEAKVNEKLAQDAITNAKFARERREAETQARIDKALQEQRVNDVIRYVGKNPYTNAEIKDSNDVEIYEAMKKAEEEGRDPVAEQYNIIKSVMNKSNTNVEQKDNGEKSDDKTQKDFDDFVKLNPELKAKDIKELFNDEYWKEFSIDMLGIKPLSKIYDLFTQTEYGKKFTTAKQKARENANKKSSTGSVNGQQNNLSRSERYDMINKNLASKTMSLKEAEDAWFKN